MTDGIAGSINGVRDSLKKLAGRDDADDTKKPEADSN